MGEDVSILYVCSQLIYLVGIGVVVDLQRKLFRRKLVLRTFVNPSQGAYRDNFYFSEDYTHRNSEKGGGRSSRAFIENTAHSSS